MIDLAIIFPVMNEEKEIEIFMKNVYKMLKKRHFTYEVICVENGSIDKSFSVLKNLTKQYKNLSVIQSEQGWGNAVITGIKFAKAKYICYMVSDGQIDAEYINLLYKRILNDHVVMVKIKRVVRENVLRLIVSRIYNMVANILFGLHSLDINGTPKIIQSSFIKNVEFSSKNICFDLELLLMLKNKNLSWIEIPAFSKKRMGGVSTTNIPSVWEMIKYILRIKFKNWKSI